jgi:hypothetical protein
MSSKSTTITNSSISSSSTVPGNTGGGSNVQVCVRVRPIASTHESAWNIPDDAPHQIQLFDAKGKLSTTYGVGKY